MSLGGRCRYGWAMLIAALWLSGCVTDHDWLAARPKPEPSASASNDAGDPPATPDAARDTTRMPDVLDTVDARPAPDHKVDAAGDGTLTLVHGITDSTDPIQFCFAPVRQGIEQALAGVPLPTSGLPFAASTIVAALDGIDRRTDGLRPYILAGDISLLSGLDCAAAVARGTELMEGAATDPADASEDANAAVDSSADGSTPDASGPLLPPPIRVAPLPLIPEKTLARDRSYLFVVYGCMGGPAFTDPSEKSVCGEFYAPLRPTLAPALVALAGPPSPESVGLQFLNASSNFPLAIVESTPVESSSLTTYEIAYGVVPGQLLPATPLQERDALELGANTGTASIQVLTTYDPRPAYDEPWAATLAAGGIDQIENGQTYTLILVGPHPGFKRNKWWNGAIVTMVRNSPAL